MHFMLSMVVAVIFGTAAGSASAWGYTGHEVIGAIADRMLSQNAAEKVREIAGMSLQAAAKWADCVKGVLRTDEGSFKYMPDPQFQGSCMELEPAGGIARMEDYVKRNWENCARDSGSEPCHRQYHYTDVAIQHTKYDRSYAGTSGHDIVSSIKAAIAVLQGKPAPSPYSIKDQKEALLMLAHFVGDIHQPLHVGAVYIDRHDQPINPDGPGNRPDPETGTRGGNWIDAGSASLHAEWDAIPASVKSDTISDKMLKQALAITKTPGEAASWPSEWATDTLQASRYSFRNITFRRDPNKPGRWAAEFDDQKKYMIAKAGIQVRQLTKAGARLGHVLNSIWP